MTEEERKEFGRYIYSLRTRQGLSLRDVEAEAGISSPYLLLIEKGERNPPKPEVLRRLARLYKVSLKALMAAAKIQEPEDYELYGNLLDRAYEYVVNDPRFTFGTHMTTDELTPAGKRFIIEMYQTVTGVDLLAELKEQEEETGNE